MQVLDLHQQRPLCRGAKQPIGNRLPGTELTDVGLGGVDTRAVHGQAGLPGPAAHRRRRSRRHLDPPAWFDRMGQIHCAQHLRPWPERRGAIVL